MTEMLCHICDKQKDKLIPKDSALLPGNRLFVCATCNRSGYEPRWIIIMAGRQFGRDTVWDYIDKRKYLGDEISAKDLGNE